MACREARRRLLWNMVERTWGENRERDGVAMGGWVEERWRQKDGTATDDGKLELEDDDF
jgi:hypothetical protein